MPSNDNHPIRNTATPDGHGQAALLLAESLIHGLCEKSVLTNLEAIEIVDRAVDVQFDLAEAADGAGAPMWRSHALLSSIATSLRTDVGEPTPPRLVS
ncbi:hypothetical protein [Sphingomonas qomolangmaensis]|uniref:Uncharacterized protein n=1 Tax=Sphingomonas qomolangmaensis TaxID=2918765 RepID=A0ABY5LA14_9SPHN|nr:hypothetical protein [Sphingomonas qomolangmaensis]UUL83800.1 hypothetical protein NMP03_06290 [Sphingomonas qomolangmaensis]